MSTSTNSAEHLPQSLPELLFARSTNQHLSSAQIRFLDAAGDVGSSMGYDQLREEAIVCAYSLLGAGLGPKDVVLASFPGHESHIRLFWGCCLAGIPICPLPVPHPDPSRQKLLLEHLQTLFNFPTFIASANEVAASQSLVPGLKALAVTDLSTTPVATPASIYPARQPSADDAVCFMLTSGSTGNSKAVLLRHSNLLSSVRGKAQHHKSDSDSVFLNWIAFDHVACVSEIHLHALHANASQYHVAPSAIVRQPVNLLQWASRYNVTYSFSPNFALAQILRDSEALDSVSDALDLSSMVALISGGEAVPTRTAVALANLLQRFGAPRSALRAGFGMSETGAGCIYDTRAIPDSESEHTSPYLSLGYSCPGVEIRIVNVNDHSVCAAGVAGQLLLHGPTIFTEYYGNPEATREAFLEPGWFNTGDLATLDADGDLHLVGRAKDAIIINGISILPIDVVRAIEDTGIKGVIPGHVFVTATRVDGADTETSAVFFQHEHEISPETDAALLLEVNASRRAIRNACVLFCSQAPVVVLPLSAASFTKTALGKVSVAQLIRAYHDGKYNDVLALLDSHRVIGGALETPLEQTVGSAIASLFEVDIAQLSRNDNIFDMGASSMHLMRLKHDIQSVLEIPELPTIEMLKRPIVGDLCDYLVLAKSQGLLAPVEYNPLVCFNNAGTKPPLFLVHPGVGEVLVFVNLARVLSDDRPVYALRARGFDRTDTTFDTFSEMSECYANEIERAHKGPYYIAGYSFGGVVAFEIAKILESRGKKVDFVGLLNIPPHIAFRMQELSYIEILVNLSMFLSLATSDNLSLLRKQLEVAFPALKGVEGIPEDPISPIEWMFERSDQARLAELDLELVPFARWVRVAYEINRTGRTYTPSGTLNDAHVSVFCAIPLPSMGTRDEFKRDRLSAWKEFAGPRFEMVDVDGEHYTMLGEEHVESFAAHLRVALVKADQPPKRVQGVFEEVPTIDFSLSTSNRAEYLSQLQYALEDVGFGILVNVPGLEDAFQQQCFAMAKEFYAQPQEAKDAIGTDKSPSLRGYFRLDGKEDTHKSHVEAFRVGPELPAPGALDDDSVPFWLKLHEGPNQWPQIEGFRSTLEILFSRYHQLNLDLNADICEMLDIPDEEYDAYFPEKTEFNSAIWHYFPLNAEIREGAKNGFAQGLHEHRDPSTFITTLIQNRPGLQVQNHAGKWIDIPYIPGGVVCNIGMQLMRLTGGRLVATTHRVNTLIIDEDRYTIPYVLTTRLEKQVQPLPQFADPNITVAKVHTFTNPKIAKLMSIEDPLERSGYARLTFFPAALKKMYPKEFAQAEKMGLV